LMCSRISPPEAGERLRLQSCYPWCWRRFARSGPRVRACPSGARPPWPLPAVGHPLANRLEPRDIGREVRLDDVANVLRDLGRAFAQTRSFERFRDDGSQEQPGVVGLDGETPPGSGTKIQPPTVSSTFLKESRTSISSVITSSLSRRRTPVEHGSSGRSGKSLFASFVIPVPSDGLPAQAGHRGAPSTGGTGDQLIGCARSMRTTRSRSRPDGAGR
jgi:hypothetical protein